MKSIKIRKEFETYQN